jgi:hypothetical protein
MAQNDDRLMESLGELKAATAEVHRLFQEAVEQPGRKPDPEQFWEALERARAARNAVSWLGKT